MDANRKKETADQTSRTSDRRKQMTRESFLQVLVAVTS